MAVPSAAPTVAALLRVFRRRWDEHSREIVAEQQAAAEKKRVRDAAMLAIAAFKLPAYDTGREAARLPCEKAAQSAACRDSRRRCESRRGQDDCGRGCPCLVAGTDHATMTPIITRKES